MRNKNYFEVAIVMAAVSNFIKKPIGKSTQNVKITISIIFIVNIKAVKMFQQTLSTFLITHMLFFTNFFIKSTIILAINKLTLQFGLVFGRILMQLKNLQLKGAKLVKLL